MVLYSIVLLSIVKFIKKKKKKGSVNYKLKLNCLVMIPAIMFFTPPATKAKYEF